MLCVRNTTCAEVGVVCREMAMWPAVYQGTHFVKLSEYNTHLLSLSADNTCIARKVP